MARRRMRINRQRASRKPRRSTAGSSGGIRTGSGGIRTYSAGMRPSSGLR